jgi:hypothetical protein
MWSLEQVATCKLQKPNVFDGDNLQKLNILGCDNFQKPNILKCINFQKLNCSNVEPKQWSTPFFHSLIHLLSLVTYNFLLSFLCICSSPLHFSQDTLSSHSFAISNCGFNIGKHHYEATLCPFTPGSMRWLYSKVHMLPVKEKCKVYF